MGRRFQSLEANHTGIDFTHAWNPPDEHSQRIDTAFTTAGVCIGDYDADGRPDLFLTRAFGGSRLYRNLGDFRFEDATREAGVADEAWDTGPAFADVDNDGDLDLYVCSHASPNRLYINRGDGTFRKTTPSDGVGLDFAGASIMMAFADYDADGDLDAYLLTNVMPPPMHFSHMRVARIDGRPQVPPQYREFADVLVRPNGDVKLVRAGQLDHLYRNNGDGTFTDVTAAAGIDGNDQGQSAIWWDYNGDRLPDLYVANDFKGADRLYRNNGDGTFTNVIADLMPHTPWYAMGADVADVNNDGRPDLLVADMSGTTHYKAKLTMGDMANEGWFLEHPTPRQYMRNALYLNSGAGRFMEAAFLADLSSTDWTWAVKFADLDCDGHVDLFVTNGMTRYLMNSDFWARLNAAPRDERARKLTEFLQNSPKRSESNLAYRNLGDLKFADVSGAWGLDYVGVSSGAALGDLDDDGDLDLVVINLDEPVSVYRNDTATGRRLKVRLVGTASNRWGVGATVHVQTSTGRQMRYMTLARGFMSVDEPLISFGLGDVDSIDRLTVQWPGGHTQQFRNLPVDRFFTITEPDGAAAASVTIPSPTQTMFKPEPSGTLAQVRHRETPFDDFQRQPLLPNKLSQLGPGLAWGDVDGDGDDDLYVGGAIGFPGTLRVNRGDGAYEALESAAWREHEQREDMAPLFFDADGDGDVDLYVVSGGFEHDQGDTLLQDRLYLNDGSGNFTTAPQGTLPAMRDSGSTVNAADYDRDGDLDLFVGGRVIPGAYPLTPNSRLLRNGGGRFRDVTDQVAPGLRQTGLVTAAVWSDADGDGWLDLLVTHEWGPVKLWRNDRGKLVDETRAASLSDRVGWYNGIAARDIDHDGDIDYAVTNFGLNTKYHASPQRPALLYYGDFDQTGVARLVEAEFEDEKLFPVRGLSCSRHAMPRVGEKFKTFHRFALAPLADIYTNQCLNDAHRYAADSLESGMLINDGKARFTFRPLPRLAQISPAFGVVLTEVNGDGHPDLYLAQNFHSPQRETGHMDGGVSLLLLGAGDDAFEPVWPDRSGLMVRGDAMGLTTTDLNGDGWPDFVVAVNDGPLRAFVNRGHEDHRVVVVRLAGRPGNTMAAGARVTVQLDDTTRQTAEVHAGSSYLSQSSSDLVFGLGRDAKVKSIIVRWPDGRTSRHDPPPHENRIVLEQPGGGKRGSDQAIPMNRDRLRDEKASKTATHQ